MPARSSSKHHLEEKKRIQASWEEKVFGGTFRLFQAKKGKGREDRACGKRRLWLEKESHTDRLSCHQNAGGDVVKGSYKRTKDAKKRAERLGRFPRDITT